MKMISSNSIRTCVSCRGKEQKELLLRLTRVAGVYQFDYEHELQGRSIYLHNQAKCINRFMKMQKRFKFTDVEFTKIIEEIEANAKQ